MRSLARRRWLQRRADDVAVALIALMFVSFLLQIVFRYVLNQPLGWTEEVTVLCWVWVVLWGAAFVLSRRATRSASTSSTTLVPPRRAARLHGRRRASRSSCCFALSLPATWNYVLVHEARALRLPATCASTSSTRST